jgi:hypothetical protein
MQGATSINQWLLGFEPFFRTLLVFDIEQAGEAGLDCVMGKFKAVVELEFLKDVIKMGLYGAFAD